MQRNRYPDEFEGDFKNEHLLSEASFSGDSEPMSDRETLQKMRSRAQTQVPGRGAGKGKKSTFAPKRKGLGKATAGAQTQSVFAWNKKDIQLSKSMPRQSKKKQNTDLGKGDLHHMIGPNAISGPTNIQLN